MTGIIGTCQQLEDAGGPPTGVFTSAVDGSTTYFRAMNLDWSGGTTYDIGASSWGHAGSTDTGIGGPLINVNGIDPEEGGTTFTFTATTTLSATDATRYDWSTTTSGDTTAMGLSITSGGSSTITTTNTSVSVSTEFSVTLDAGNNGDSCNIVYSLSASNNDGTTNADSLTIRVRAASF